MNLAGVVFNVRSLTRGRADPVQGVALNIKTFQNLRTEFNNSMAVVTVNSGEGIESALRRFKRKVMSEEIIKDAKKHAFFMPPGQKAKLKSALARKRNKRKNRPSGMRPR